MALLVLWFFSIKYIHLFIQRLRWPCCCVGQRRDISVWVKPIVPAGSVAVAVLNRSSSGPPRLHRLRLGDVAPGPSASVSRYRVTEVFDARFVGVFKPTHHIEVRVNPTGVYFLTAVPAVTVCDELQASAAPHC